MRAVEEALGRLAESDRPLVEVPADAGTPGRVLTYRQITRAAQALVEQLASTPRPDTPRPDAPRPDAPSPDALRPEAVGPLRVGLVCGNTPAFVVADIALLAARAVEVPVPLAFSAEQAASLLEEADLCLVDAQGEQRLAAWGRDRVLRPDCVTLRIDENRQAGPLRLPPADPEGADWECKTIHTSGTTSRPKGVRIRAHALDALLTSLRTVMPPGAFTRYVSVVPFSLLIEQVTGLYLVLLDGGTLVQLPERMALVGTSATAPRDVLPFLAAARPTAMVAPPALVGEFAEAAEAALRRGEAPARALFGTAGTPLICCGGAPVHVELLRRLEELGLPVHEGYGLSENSSVVSWNTPQARRLGTVGRPLPHVRVRVDDDGELLVSSTSLFAGYTRSDPSSLAVDADGWLHTGDLAAVDGDGYIRITGRKKNVIITAAGRNVAPEWVEAQYARLPFVHAVAVVGNGLDVLHGLFLVAPGTDPDEAREALAAFGAEHLSEVERVGVAHVLPTDEELYRTFFTVTGRPMRTAVEKALSEGSITSHRRSER